MLSKKHYENIAAIIKDEVTEAKAVGAYGRLDALEIVAHRLANYLAGDSPKFNRGRFIKVCGISYDDDEG